MAARWLRVEIIEHVGICAGVFAASTYHKIKIKIWPNTMACLLLRTIVEVYKPSLSPTTFRSSQLLKTSPSIKNQENINLWQLGSLVFWNMNQKRFMCGCSGFLRMSRSKAQAHWCNVSFRTAFVGVYKPTSAPAYISLRCSYQNDVVPAKKSYGTEHMAPWLPAPKI